MGLFKKCLCASPSAVTARRTFFVAPRKARGLPMGVPRYRSAGQKGALGRIKKGACQDGVRDFFETARGLKFGLAIIFCLTKGQAPACLSTCDGSPLFLPLKALDDDYALLFSFL